MDYMNKRKITDPYNVKFEPFDNYGSVIPGMSWHKITYKKETGQGTYILKMDPGAKSLLHKHPNYEEFIILDGELIDPDNKVLKKGDLLLDDLKQLCFWKNKIIELTVAEFNLIKSLAKQPGVIKDRNQLMDAMYGDMIYVDDRTIDSHIKRLRKKFKSIDSEFDQIRTRYGSGYSWRE